MKVFQKQVKKHLGEEATGYVVVKELTEYNGFRTKCDIGITPYTNFRA